MTDFYTEENPAIELYLDLMKRTLTRTIAKDYSEPVTKLIPLIPGLLAAKVNGKLYRFLKSRNIEVVRKVPVDPEKRRAGKDWPREGETMIGLERLDNLQYCITDVIRTRVPGDFIETGVWRGGATIFMRAALKAFGEENRTVWVADSFEGLPKPDAEKYPADEHETLWVYDELRVSLEEVKENFRRYGLLDDRVKFLKGWFRDTLHAAPIERLAILRLDGDMYESTTDALNALYPKLSAGGYLIIDDYALENCRKAIHDYREKHGIMEEIVKVDWSGCYWQKLG